MQLFNKYIFSALLLVLIASCSGIGPSNEPTDTPTSGDVNVVVDESFQQLFDTQIYTFQSLYPNAKVHTKYLAESEALNRMMNDSCKVVVMCRDLTTTEKKQFEAKNLFPISTKIAEDAIALIVNPENTDSTITLVNVKAILSGKDSLWDQLNKPVISVLKGAPLPQKGKINVVFDNNGSANMRYMRDSLLGGKAFGNNTFAVNSNPEVIEYVSKHKNAIGVLSVNWISDRDDPTVMSFLKKVKVLAVSKTDTAEAFKPFQAYIKTKDYAFTRSVYMINRQTRAGLGMGFVSFVAGDKGQLMILKAGLVPAIAPVRLVEVRTK